MPTMTPVAPRIAATPQHDASAHSPSPETSGGEQKAGDDDNDFDLDDEPQGTDFEIEADATSFDMPVNNRVWFKAKALNGTPPFTFTWDFGDGSPKATGEKAEHAFLYPATFDVTCVGTDASGATSQFHLSLSVNTPEDYVKKFQLDPSEADNYRFPSPTPEVTP